MIRIGNYLIDIYFYQAFHLVHFECPYPAAEVPDANLDQTDTCENQTTDNQSILSLSNLNNNNDDEV